MRRWEERLKLTATRLRYLHARSFVSPSSYLSLLIPTTTTTRSSVLSTAAHARRIDNILSLLFSSDRGFCAEATRTDISYLMRKLTKLKRAPSSRSSRGTLKKYKIHLESLFFLDLSTSTLNISLPFELPCIKWEHELMSLFWVSPLHSLYPRRYISVGYAAAGAAFGVPTTSHRLPLRRTCLRFGIPDVARREFSIVLFSLVSGNSRLESVAL